MTFVFSFTKKAVEDLSTLDTLAKKRITKKLLKFSQYNDLSHIAKSLSGTMSGYHRIRVGDYRLVCEIEESVVTVMRVQHRKEVYR